MKQILADAISFAVDLFTRSPELFHQKVRHGERDLTFAAKKLPDDVPAATKKRRLAEIVAVQERISAAVFAAQVGRTETVLVHCPSKRRADEMIGRTDGFKTVILPAGIGPLQFNPEHAVEILECHPPLVA